jgi:DNA sulfur modification protein DndD
MRIKNIELHNFGSYADHNSFSFESSSPEERVVVIGGKNGAGKTTLFTAVQVCLYGHYAFGYKSASKKYFSEIYNLINSQVRIDEKENAYLEIIFQQVDNTDLFEYVIRRSWTWELNEIRESLAVRKNGQPLEEDELVNFQNYLIHLIPPDMLKLYFFDGEKIADFFLEEGSNARIKGAFLTLCGYDTFDMMSKNFKRISNANSGSSSNALTEYLAEKLRFETSEADYVSKKNEYDACLIDISNCEADIKALEESYSRGGGISKEEWDALLAELKSEEKKREVNNAWLKRVANDYLPFLILKE